MVSVNEQILSEYLDGKLPYTQACEVSELLEQNQSYHTTMIGLLKTHILLKTVARETFAEKVPVTLIETLRSIKPLSIMSMLVDNSIAKTAIVVAICVLGFTLGRFSLVEQPATNILAPHMPVGLEHTLNQVLENNKSGLYRVWEDKHGSASARIVPVKTLRGNDGRYYRVYHVNLTEEGKQQKFVGLAHRQDRNHWVTQSFFMKDSNQKI